MKKILIIIFLALLLTACGQKAQEAKNMKNDYQNIRVPAVAGQFYPVDADDLKFVINKYLQSAASSSVSSGEDKNKIMAIMAPHAGYDYSAPVAAYAYQAIAGRQTGTVILIGNSHRAYFSGMAIDDADAWQTPLGLIAIDKQLADKLVAGEQAIKYNHSPHADEHSLEVQLPFLQTVLATGFKIVPILFGNSGADDYKKLARALADNFGQDDLIVISTDMSHYPAYGDANRIDSQTLEIIKTLDIAKLNDHIKQIESEDITGESTLICGADGVKTIMELSNLKKWSANILHYANSGDAAIGNKTQVVGYGAVAFELGIKNEELKINNTELSSNDLNSEQKQKLLEIARGAVETFVRDGDVPEFKINDERLNWKEGAFVTLHKDGNLRGCIGQIVPSDQPLWQVVRDMAVAACSEDTRFAPVSPDELGKIDYEISVLSRPEKIDDWQKIEMGKHGVIVRQGYRGGVFLPQVATETGWSREEFLSQLCSQKAGLPSDCYLDPDTELQVFTAQVF